MSKLSVNVICKILLSGIIWIDLMRTLSISNKMDENNFDLEKLFDTRSFAASDCEVTPIYSSSIRLEATVIEARETRIEHAKWTGLRTRGASSTDHDSLAVFLSSGNRNSIYHAPIEELELIWVPAGVERSAAYPDLAELVVLSFAPGKLFDCESFKGQIMRSKMPVGGGVFRLSPGAKRALAPSVRSLLLALQSFQNVTPTRRVYDFAFESFLEAMTNAIIQSSVDPLVPCDSRICYATLISLAEDILRNQDDQLYTVDQVSECLGVSGRTLHRAFVDVVGTTPASYLRNWRLARARNDLVSGRGRTVVTSAMDWGFFDLGRFAGRYKQMYGELPSKTISNRRIIGDALCEWNLSDTELS